MEVITPDRPVARPLRFLVGYEDIFEDPVLPPRLETIAIEDDEPESPAKPAPSNPNAARIAFLKAELAKLESETNESERKALESRCGWGPVLSKREIHMTNNSVSGKLM